MAQSMNSFWRGTARCMWTIAVIAPMAGCPWFAEENLTTRLYVGQAYHGYFVPTKAAGVYELNLTNLAPEMAWFTDRPEHIAGKTDWPDFLNAIWPRVFLGEYQAGAIAYRLEDGVWEMMPAEFCEVWMSGELDEIVWQVRMLGTPPRDMLTGVTVYLDDQGISEPEPESTGVYLCGAADCRFEVTETPGRYRAVLDYVAPEVHFIATPPDFFSIPQTVDLFVNETWLDSFDSDPPNAAFTIEAPDGSQHTLVAVLSEPQWDADAGTLTFLADPILGNPEGLEGPATVFIDDAYWEDGEDTTIYKVVINHEEYYSIWPADRENPLGWYDVGKMGTKRECLEYIEEVWTDMRPLSLRKKMEEMERQRCIEAGGTDCR